MSILDRRLNAYRPDLADERLSGQVEAGRFTAGTLMQVSDSVVDLRAEPRPDSGPQTQIIFGDTVRVFEEQDGWCWVQAERDGYTGYVSATSLEKPVDDATHMVIVARTFVYPGNDLRFRIQKHCHSVRACESSAPLKNAAPNMHCLRAVKR